MEPTTPLKDIALAHPAAASVLETLHLDYCCGGKKSLAQACEEVGLDVEAVLARLERALAQPAVEPSWAQTAAMELISHIIETHHSYTRTELARLETLISKVANRHGEAHPELKDIGECFLALRDDLAPHLLKEENILFPYIEALEKHQTEGAPLPPACFGVIDNPLCQMNAEHEAVGGLLKRMRRLARDYVPPADACTSYRAAFQGLEALENDLIRHIHLENNVLFPKALELAARV